MNKFDLIRKDVREIISKSPIDSDQIHSDLALKWLLKLKPDANEALQIAAMAHDIDRGITGITEKDCKDYSKIHEFKKEHAIRSADFIADLMEKHNYDKEIIEKVKHLVKSHEEGGDEEQTFITEADSLAYFDYNVPGYYKRYGKEQTIKKIHFMYNRLGDKAKKLIHQIKFEDKEISQIVKESISK